MRNELLLSAMLPICGMAGEAYGMPPGDAVPAPKEQPNIILFLVDDMGWQDTSLPFGHSVPSTTIRTILPTWNGWLHKAKCLRRPMHAASVHLRVSAFYGNECCQASSHQLDPPQEHYP